MTFTLPAKSLVYLALSCAAAFAVYVVLMIGALYFASSATELAGMVRTKEAEVVALETKYYAAITTLTKTDPLTLGYVMPSKVVYVEAVGGPALSRAER